MQTKIKLLASGVISAIFLQGCSVFGLGTRDDFSCSEIKGPDTCLPASKIYQMSEDTDKFKENLNRYDRSDENFDPQKGEVVDRHQSIDKSVEKTDAEVELAPQVAETKTILPTPEEPVVIMKKPKLARVWIGPWRDENNVLHMPTHSYIVIEQGGFEFGIDMADSKTVKFKPLQVQTSSSNDQGAGLAPLTNPSYQLLNDAMAPLSAGSQAMQALQGGYSGSQGHQGFSSNQNYSGSQNYQPNQGFPNSSSGYVGPGRSIQNVAPDM